MAREKGLIRRVLERAIVVPKEEMEVTEIVTGQSLTDTVDIILGMRETEVKITRLSDESQIKTGMYIPERKAYLFSPLNRIASALGIDVSVEFYDISGVPVYFVREPEVTGLVKKIYIYLKSRIGETGLSSGADIIEFAKQAFEDLGIDARIAFAEKDVKAAVYYVWRDLVGYGPLEIPMEDAMVEEVSWFSYDGPVLVVDKKVPDIYPNAEFVFTNIFLPKYLDDIKKKFFMTQIVRTITSRARAGLTTAKPIAEARIPDPSGRGFHRLAAHLDITSRSPGLTIRKFPQVKLSLTKLLHYNTLSSLEAAYLLYQLIKRGFILIVGGMASGKTTLLQALISALPVMYKVVTIEDTPELSTPAQNWHPLYVRKAPKESELENVDFSRLVIHSLRHRGTVVTLGEVRGKEMADLIQAAASGHGAICLRPGARVVVRSGGKEYLLRMEDVYREIARGADLEILSYDLKTGRTVWKKITKAIHVKTKAWVRIYTATGRTIEVTPDHQLPVIDEKGASRIKHAAEIRVGDRLLIAPRHPKTGKVKKFLIISNRYVEINGALGKLYGTVLASGKIYSKKLTLPKDTDPEAVELLRKVAKVRTGKRRLSASQNAVRLIERLEEIVRFHPLSLPSVFLQEVYKTLKKYNKHEIVLRDEDTAYALHYALRTIGVDSVVNGNVLRIIGEVDGLQSDTVTRIEIIESDDFEDAYDIEVEDTHTFIVDSSIISMNCTFHAHDPDTVLARITSPPINAAPESLLLITSIVHIAYTKTFKHGRPEPVRRVMRIFEITDVKGRRAVAKTVFEWHPITDEHYPVFNPYDLEKATLALKHLWENSRTVRILGANTYGHEEPYRALVDIYTLAYFLEEMKKKEVFDIKQLLLRLSAFYLKMDALSYKLWTRYFSKLFREYGIIEKR